MRKTVNPFSRSERETHGQKPTQRLNCCFCSAWRGGRARQLCRARARCRYCAFRGFTEPQDQPAVMIVPASCLCQPLFPFGETHGRKPTQRLSGCSLQCSGELACAPVMQSVCAQPVSCLPGLRRTAGSASGHDCARKLFMPAPFSRSERETHGRKPTQGLSDCFCNAWGSGRARQLCRERARRRYRTFRGFTEPQAQPVVRIVPTSRLW